MRIVASVVLRLATMAAVIVNAPSALAAQVIVVSAPKPAEVQTVRPGALLSRPAHLTVKNVPLASALAELQVGSHVSLMFSPSALPQDRKVSCQCATKTVGQSLGQLLRDTDLVYSEVDNSILVEPAGPNGPATAQARIITGKVTDSLTSDPVTTGQVSTQGASTGTTINSDGTFTLSAPVRDVTLLIRSIGFRRKEIVVPANQNVVAVSLARDYFQLEAIVVTGQATGVEKRNLANAVATVSATELTKTPTYTLESALQGKLAGAQVSENSGAPGGGANVGLRGVTSINGDFAPLYVVDGVIMSNAVLGNGTGIVRRSNATNIVVDRPVNDNIDNRVNRIADLNPNDIESVEVLKGASASAIYGSKASSGVIIVTTKRGRVGTPQFNITQRFGTSALSRKKGTRQFNTLAEATAAFGPVVAQDWAPPDQKFFDQEDLLYGNKPLSYETSASMSGGSESTQYFASLLNTHDGGIVPNTFANKQSLRLNLSQKIGSRLSFDVGAEVLRSANDRGLTLNTNNGASIGFGVAVTPGFIDLRGTCVGVTVSAKTTECSDGSTPVFRSNPYGRSNPFQTVALLQNRESVWRSIQSARMQLDMITTARHTLRFIANGGGDEFVQKNAVLSPPVLQFEQASGIPGTSAVSFGQNENFNINGNLVHVFRAGSGTTATTQFGVQFEGNNFDVSRTLSRNLIGGQPNVDWGTITQIQQQRQRQRALGLFGQEEFLTLNERLLLTVGGRADMSTNNADAKKLFFYPKTSASYRIPVGGVLTELKLRAALGESGNLPTFGQKFTELKPGNYQGVPTETLFPNQLSLKFTPASTAAPDLHPERQREIEAGMDATMLGSRAHFEATVYEKRISDLALDQTLAPSSGFGSVTVNGGKMRTRGMELALELLPIESADFQWNVRGTYFLSRCIILSLPVPAFQPVAAANFPTFVGSTFIEPGKSCTQVIGQDTLGAEAGDAARGAIGSLITRTLADQTPRYNFSVGNTLTYKRLSLYFLWDRRKGGVISNLDQRNYDGLQTSVDFATPRQPGALTGAQRIAAAAKTVRPYLQDVTYLKLREVSLSFDLPQPFIRSFWSGARHARLVVSGRNLLTFTPYWWSNPENVSSVMSPARGVSWDVWSYPMSRSFWFSVDLGF